MEHIAYWSLLGIILLIAIYLTVKKGFTMVDWIIFLTLWGFSGFVDGLLSSYLHLYYYVDRNINELYSLIYDMAVFPSLAVIFLRLLPRDRNFIKLALFTISWIAGFTFMELLIIGPFNIIIYTGWKILPYSLIFYIIVMPMLTWYCINLTKRLSKEK